VIQRRVGRRWRRVTSDLGLRILWTVDEDGRYEANWEIPFHARRGRYRMVVRAKRYRLVSRTFRVGRNVSLRLERAPAPPGRLAVRLAYPRAVRDRDLTHRPQHVSGGLVRFRVGGRLVTARRKRSKVFSVRAPAGVPVEVGSNRARDRFGNRAGAGLRLRG
jgi:hypothetical protein